MKKTLSYSGYNKYVTCPYMWKLHYIERLRPAHTTSALVFGSAMDAAINALMQHSDALDVAGTFSPVVVLNKGLSELLTQPVQFHPRDYDGEIIGQPERDELLKQAQALGYGGDDVDGLVAGLMQKIQLNQPLSDNQTKVLALACATSLRAKGLLMLEAYRKHVLPVFARIEGVQLEVKRGVLDFVAEVKGHGRVIGDNKTASMPYDDDAVKWSIQLAGYDAADKGMYVVLHKNIAKNRVKTCKACGTDGTGKRHKSCFNCGGEWLETIQPEAKVQIIIDHIPERTKQLAREAYDEVEKAVKAKCFPRNLNACRNQFGKPCVYLNHCWNGSDEGLVKGDK